MFASSLSVSASANFLDVKQGDWYYETITEMTEKGLFNGKGNNLFCPDDTMTKAEFITVTMRILYPDIDFTSMEGQPWWQSAYDMALAGLITQAEFPVSEIEQTISRQEMALVSSKALMMRGETFFITEHLHKKIPDYNQVGKEYTMYVEMAYSMGILCGVDDKGTFAPLQTLTRAEASTVLYRIIEKSARVEVDFDSPITETQTQGAITIYEGQYRTNRNAQEGDLFIKKDGTQIVLKKGPSGVVGEGQGVAPDIGMYGTNGGYVTAGDNWENKLMFGLIDESLHPYFVNAKGYSLNNDTYRINATTGEGHWSTDWSIIEESIGYMPDYDGTYNGELSKDAYSFYVWDNDIGMWFANFTK